MLNPFKYGEVVTGDNFINRKKEVKNISNDLYNGLKCFIISSRRYGKTSLIKKIIKKMRKKGFLIAYIDLYGVTSLEEMAAVISRAYAESYETKTEYIWRIIKNLIPRLRPTFIIDEKGKFRVEIDAKEKKDEIYNTLRYLFDFPAEISRKKKKKYIVVYDEFQEIFGLGGVSLEKLMRSSFQMHSGAGYLFSGSKKSIMTDMVSNKERAFYKMGPVYFLEKIKEYEWVNFVGKNFRKFKIRFEDEAVNLIIEKAQNVPYYVQFLAYETLAMSVDDRFVNVKKVEAAVDSVCCKMRPLYAAWWDDLTLNQKQLLKAVSNAGGRSLYSNNFLSKARLSAALVQKNIKPLINKEIIEKENDEYAFSDVWFKEWIKKI